MPCAGYTMAPRGFPWLPGKCTPLGPPPNPSCQRSLGVRQGEKRGNFSATAARATAVARCPGTGLPRLLRRPCPVVRDNVGREAAPGRDATTGLSRQLAALGPPGGG